MAARSSQTAIKVQRVDGEAGTEPMLPRACDEPPLSDRASSVAGTCAANGTRATRPTELLIVARALRST